MPPKSWDPWKAFDIGDKERQLIEKRREMREFWAADYARKSRSPYRPANRLVFDPAIQRAIAARATMQDFFRPNRQTTLMVALVIAVPVAYTWCYMKFYREPFLKAMSNGEIPYRSRNYKELY